MVLHRKFSDAGRGDGRGQGGYEPVHVRIQPHALQQLPAICLERAAVVANRHAGDPPDQPVRHPGGDLSGNQLVATPHAVTSDQVVSLCEFGHQPRDVPWIVLQVSVHAHDDLPARVIEARLHRSRLPVVPGERDHANTCVGSRQGADHLSRPIRATIVDQD